MAGVGTTGAPAGWRAAIGIFGCGTALATAGIVAIAAPVAPLTTAATATMVGAALHAAASAVAGRWALGGTRGWVAQARDAATVVASLLLAIGLCRVGVAAPAPREGVVACGAGIFAALGVLAAVAVTTGRPPARATD